MTRESAVRIAVVLPELLGTYGDGGNGLILERRLRRRGIDRQPSQCRHAAPVPAADQRRQNLGDKVARFLLYPFRHRVDRTPSPAPAEASKSGAPAATPSKN